MCNNNLNLTTEQILSDMKFIGLDLKPEFLTIVGADEVEGTYLITVRYDEPGTVDELYAFKTAAIEAAKGISPAAMATTILLNIEGYALPEDPNIAHKVIEFMYVKGKDAEDVARSLRIRQMVSNLKSLLGM